MKTPNGHGMIAAKDLSYKNIGTRIRFGTVERKVDYLITGTLQSISHSFNSVIIAFRHDTTGVTTHTLNPKQLVQVTGVYGEYDANTFKLHNIPRED